jgi:hypothetical protein
MERWRGTRVATAAARCRRAGRLPRGWADGKRDSKRRAALPRLGGTRPCRRDRALCAPRRRRLEDGACCSRVLSRRRRRRVPRATTPPRWRTDYCCTAAAATTNTNAGTANTVAHAAIAGWFIAAPSDAATATVAAAAAEAREGGAWSHACATSCITPARALEGFPLPPAGEGTGGGGEGTGGGGESVGARRPLQGGGGGTDPGRVDEAGVSCRR